MDHESLAMSKPWVMQPAVLLEISLTFGPYFDIFNIITSMMRFAEPDYSHDFVAAPVVVLTSPYPIVDPCHSVPCCVRSSPRTCGACWNMSSSAAEFLVMSFVTFDAIHANV